MRNKIFLAITVLMALFGSSLAFGAPSTLEDAQKAYNEKKYAEAAEIYNSIIEKDGYSAELLFNLGNTYVKAGDMGYAVVCYEKALKLDPSDSRIKNNLEYVNSKISDANVSNLKNKKVKVVADEPSFSKSVSNFFVRGQSSDSWAVFGIVAFLLLMACAGMYLFSEEVMMRKVGFFGGMVCAVATVFFVVVAFMASNGMKSHDEGVVMAYKTALLADPEIGASASSAELSKGTKLQIIDQEKNQEGETLWYKVRLNSDYVGWIQAKNFVVI